MRTVDIDIEMWEDVDNDEMRFTVRAGARRDEMEACRWGEACSKERKPHDDMGGVFPIHSLQSRLSLACRPVQP